jgi:hypothetical protein
MTLTPVDRHALDRLHAEHHFTLLIAGGARGADTLASEWGDGRAVFRPYIRNQRMLDGGKHYLVIKI